MLRTIKSASHDSAANCQKCPRLVAYRQSIQPKASLFDRPYHNAPVMPFGDDNAWLLIIGLAPGAHGANRTVFQTIARNIIK